MASSSHGSLAEDPVRKRQRPHRPNVMSVDVSGIPVHRYSFFRVRGQMSQDYKSDYKSDYKWMGHNLDLKREIIGCCRTLLVEVPVCRTHTHTYMIQGVCLFRHDYLFTKYLNFMAHMLMLS